MSDSSDPSVHRLREQQLIDHVERLLNDDRLRVDTVTGRRPVPTLIRQVEKSDREVDLKRVMTEMSLPDRALQARMPVGRTLTATLWRSKWFLFKQLVGRVKVVCLSPTRSLLAGNAGEPMTAAQVRQAISKADESDSKAPTTLVVLSTSGFDLEAHEVAERRAERTVILVEPNAGGGWTVSGPVETQALVDLFDPEPDDAKRKRLREFIEQGKSDLLSGSLSAEKLAAAAQLPLQLVETELRSYANANPGLVAKRLDGRVVLFREGNAPSAVAGGLDMPFLQRLKALFSRKGDNEKKITFLSERRAALSQQRDIAYEEMSALEKKEDELRTRFKEATVPSTRKRITTQLLQLRKDLERRQQLLGVLNQQVNVVSTHLHSIELVQQGTGARLPDSEELASDAAAAEQVLADLQASNELAGSLGAGSTVGLTDEEQALYEELEREASRQPADKESSPAMPIEPIATESPAHDEPTPQRTQPDAPQKRPAEPEPG